MIVIRVELAPGQWSAPVRESVGGSQRERLHMVHEVALAHPGRRLLAEYGRGSTAIYDDAALARMRRRNGFSVPEGTKGETAK